MVLRSICTMSSFLCIAERFFRIEILGSSENIGWGFACSEQPQWIKQFMWLHFSTIDFDYLSVVINFSCGFPIIRL